MSTQHTPGPWAFSTSTNGWCYTINIFQADNATPTDGWSDVGYIIKTCEGEQQAVQHANARLIAAAPELLEACQTFAEWLRREEEGFTRAGRDRSTPEGEAAWREWYYENLRICDLAQEQARAAIAKATGGAV